MKKASSVVLIPSILMIVGSISIAYGGIFYSWAVHDRALANMVWILIYKAVLLLVAGIMGFTVRNKPEMVNSCIRLAIFILACNALYLLAPIFTGAGQSSSIPGGSGQRFAFIILAMNTPIPLWYLIAAYKFKRVVDV